MRQRIAHPAILPLANDLSVKEVFADACVGVNVLNGNVHFTFAAVVADHALPINETPWVGMTILWK